MKIVITSDLHGYTPIIPECDLLLIAGDYAPVNDERLGAQAAFLAGPFKQWLERVPARHVVGIAGNHDSLFERNPDLLPRLRLRWHYLQDSGVEIEGLRIYGIPWVPYTHMAFHADTHKMSDKYGRVPENTDIVLAHGPPFAYCDRYGEPLGGWQANTMIKRRRPVLYACGHIHEGYGHAEHSNGVTQIVNASHCTIMYEPTNDPITIELGPRGATGNAAPETVDEKDIVGHLGDRRSSTPRRSPEHDRALVPVSLTPYIDADRQLFTATGFWVISDTHWLHSRIPEYEPIRAELPLDHNRVMVDRWRETVGENDIVVHLGDLMLGKHDAFWRISEQLPGRKFMLKTGNHDKRSRNWYAGHGFVLIPEFWLDYQGWRARFTHWPDDSKAFVQYPRTLNVHGHVHSETRADRRLINLSVEAIDFRPVWITDVLDERVAELRRDQQPD